MPNRSDIIRWSLDLRWQNPYQSYGFYDVKQGIVFRSGNEKKVTKEDWEHFNNVDRHKLETKDRNETNNQRQEDADFEPIIIPFYAKRWPMVHENKHTAKLLQVV